MTAPPHESKPPRYAPLLAHPDDFPAPITSMLARAIRVATKPALHQHLPTHPQVGASDEPSAPTSIFTAEQLTHAQTRYALIDACQALGLQGAAVILPAFHCRSLVEPIVQAGALPVFAPMDVQLRYRLPELERVMLQHRPKALILTHYFGFSAWSDALAALCHKHGLAIIEDCAHALYGQVHEGASQGQPLGSLGQAACASAWKFLPMDDGACLRWQPSPGSVQQLGSEQRRRAAPMHSQTWRAQASSVKSLLQGLLQGRLAKRSPRDEQRVSPQNSDGDHQGAKLEPMRPTGTKSAATLVAQTLALRQSRVGRPRDPRSLAETVMLEDALVGASARWASQWMFRRADHALVAQRRRHAYQLWLEVLAGCQVLRPLYPELLPGVVPYTMPVLADAHGLAFDALRLGGVPIWRWEDLACDALACCPVSRTYRYALLQLPCHQDLDAATLQALIAIVRQVDAEVLPALLDQVVLERVMGEFGVVA